MLNKEHIHKKYADHLENLGFIIVDSDFERPWGGFIRVDDAQKDLFTRKFFTDIPLPESFRNLNLSPKILIVEPGKRLSWQVHERRGEFWKVLEGPVGVFLSDSDDQPENPEIHAVGKVIDIPQGTRHRLFGLDNWGVVAEFWIHSDHQNPSDEQDIRRIQDDFGR